MIYVRWTNTHYDHRVADERRAQTGSPLMQTGETNFVAMAGFAIFIGLSLVITWFAARRTRSTEHFYAAGRSITAFQNGLALAGDYMSAASFLGIAGLVALSGFDGLIYSIGFLVGWPVVVCLIAEPLRNLGKYTFSDVVAFRLRQTPVRVASAAGSLAVVAFYLIAQMVGAGNLIRLLFGLELRDRGRDRRPGDAGLRAVRRHDRDDVGADREGGAAADRRVHAGDDGAAEVLVQSAGAVRRSRRGNTATACSRRDASSRIRSTASRWAWR